MFGKPYFSCSRSFPLIETHQTEVVKFISDILAIEFGLSDAVERPDLKNISDFYQKDNGNFWLAINDNKIIGTIALADYGAGRGYLKRMYVDAAYRRQGIAQQLLSTLIDFAKEKDYKTIFLGRLSSMTAANNFYQKNGFTKIKRLPADFPEFGDDVFYKYDRTSIGCL